MIPVVDFWLFGNGKGLAAPGFSQTFYWLPYEIDGKRFGSFYHWIGGFGAQLGSFQWTHPKPGERRLIKGREYYAYNSRRKNIRVSVSWATTLGSTDYSDVAAIKIELEKGIEY